MWKCIGIYTAISHHICKSPSAGGFYVAWANVETTRANVCPYFLIPKENVIIETQVNHPPSLLRSM
jgi:hypothetical protein